MRKESAWALCLEEIRAADRHYGVFRSSHEGLGVLMEEVAELVEAVRSNRAEDIGRESCQVAAVALRLAASMDDSDTRIRSGVCPK
jgi:NTP pyrophosphatase (non-canonical NTP hydrolase)